jgi:hypothetical protein
MVGDSTIDRVVSLGLSLPCRATMTPWIGPGSSSPRLHHQVRPRDERQADCQFEHEDDPRSAALECLRDNDPAMVATIVTVEVRIEATRTLDEGVTDRLTDAPGSQRVDDGQPAWRQCGVDTHPRVP